MSSPAAGVEVLAPDAPFLPGGSARTIDTKVRDRAALQETWSVYASRLFLQKPYPSVAGAYTVLRLLSRTNPAVKGITPDRILDLSLVRELNQTGEIDWIVARFSR